MRYTGPKNKVARREKMDLGMKTLGSKSHATLLKRLNVGPGQHGAKGRRKVSERRKQLREKQKLRFLFGITETQLKNYFDKAKEKKGNTAIHLANLLEARLDNIVYRLGFAPTRASARQLVSHKHINVNEKTVNISSYNVVKSETIGFAKTKSSKIPYIDSLLGNKSIIIPGWLERKGSTGRIVGDPEADEVEKNVDLRSVIEFYSR